MSSSGKQQPQNSQPNSSLVSDTASIKDDDESLQHRHVGEDDAYRYHRSQKNLKHQPDEPDMCIKKATSSSNKPVARQYSQPDSDHVSGEASIKDDDPSPEYQHDKADGAYRYQRSKKRTRLPDDFTIIDDDVLCGRGKDSFHHAGNRRFRKVVTKHVPKYDNVKTKKEKTAVVKEVIDILRKRGGIFCKKDEKTGKYYQIGETDCRIKVGHALRDSMSARRNINKIHEQHMQMQSDGDHVMEPINPSEDFKSPDIDRHLADFLRENSLFSDSFTGDDEIDSSYRDSQTSDSE